MALVSEVELRTQSLRRFAHVLGDGPVRNLREIGAEMAERLEHRVFWNVNSTAVGGGVAEMLLPLVGYARGAGVDARWLVIGGNSEFFRLTKRIHHALHGMPGDGSPLGAEQHHLYQETLHRNAQELGERVREGDVVLLHDPQTAGLAPGLLRAGARVVWRCHIGSDQRNEHLDAGWRFLQPYLADVPRLVFSRAAYVPAACDRGRSFIIRPSIDAFSAKNCELDPLLARTALVHTGLLEGPPPDPSEHRFRRADDTWGRIERRAQVVRLGRAPTADTPLVVQVSRWDPLKDPVGVMLGFAQLVDGTTPAGAQLVLAGPNVEGVSDDPEGATTLDQVIDTWRALPNAAQQRIHIASLPTDDVEENAIMVNALQRHAAVVVQKSLREGFGLTVTEAMWKSRPVVASAVGGIQDQIVDGESGLLLADPTDEESFAGLLRRVLENPGFARKLGDAAHERARTEFLGVRHLRDYARLLRELEI